MGNKMRCNLEKRNWFIFVYEGIENLPIKECELKRNFTFSLCWLKTFTFQASHKCTLDMIFWAILNRKSKKIYVHSCIFTLLMALPKHLWVSCCSLYLVLQLPDTYWFSGNDAYTGTRKLYLARAKDSVGTLDDRGWPHNNRYSC